MSSRKKTSLGTPASGIAHRREKWAEAIVRAAYRKIAPDHLTRKALRLSLGAERAPESPA